jgi:bacillithiol biosynthesis cysteine-adding enzyme BshC
LNTYTISFSSLYNNAKSFSKLFLDYISNTEQTSKLIQTFFRWDFRQSGDFEQHFVNLAQKEYRRQEICELLKSQHERFGSTDSIAQNIEKLQSRNTFGVITGQQVGVYSGPLYTIYKALSAITLAEKLHELYPDYEFVPIFWLEAEDHDVEEVSEIASYSGNSLNEFTLEFDHQKKHSVGKRLLPESIRDFNDGFLETLPKTEFYDQISECIHTCYNPSFGYKDAFAKMLVKLLGSEGLLLIDSDCKEFKTLCKPLFLKEMETFPKTSQQIIAQSALLEEAGYASQAKARAINLFMFDENGERLKLEPLNDNTIEVVETNQTFQRSQLLELIEESPERFSPNVILRSLVQDFVLPTSAYIAGPGEISYMAQFKTLYDFYNVPAPIIYPRASITLVEPKIDRLLDKALLSLKLDGKKEVLEAFFSDPQAFENTLITADSKMAIDQEFTIASNQLDDLLKTLSVSVSDIDLTLLPSLEKLAANMQQQLWGFKNKVLKSEKQRNSDLIKQIEKCNTHLLPKGTLQERMINILYFLNKYGPDLIGELRQVLKKHSPEEHIVIEL